MKITNFFYLFFIGSGLISLVNFALGVIMEPIQLSNNIFFDLLTRFYIQDMSSLLPFSAVLIAWTITGLVAGIMEKRALMGALSAFLSLALSFAVILGLGIATGGVIEDWITGTVLGALGVVIVASIAGYVGGTYSTQQKEPDVHKADRKIWKNPKYEKRWTCQNCGSKIPPGAMECPNCGKGVIE